MPGDWPVEKVEFLVNGNVVQVVTASQAIGGPQGPPQNNSTTESERAGITQNYTIDWVPDLPGQYNIRALVTDTRQTLSLSPEKTITVKDFASSLPPVVAVTYPTATRSITTIDPNTGESVTTYSTANTHHSFF